MLVAQSTRERLEGLRRRVAGWRQTRRRHGPMPEELWREAAVLARELGVSRVSHAVGIGYAGLSDRVGASGPQAAESGETKNRFVELSGAQWAASSTLGAASGPLIEVVAADGARLTIRLPAGSAVDVAAVVRAHRGELR
jgi:hypothetical protein